MSTPTANGKAPGKWEAQLTPAMIAQVKAVGAPHWIGAGQIAYVQDHNQRADLYLADATGGLPLQLTADRAPIPVFTGGLGGGYAVSPDGGTIVYTSPEDGKLHAVAITGGKAKRITEGEGGHASPQFSPDGKRLVFTADRAESVDVAVIDADGEGWPQRISRGDAFPFDPQWSPDGTQIAYAEYDREGYPWHHTRIIVADLASGALRTLVEWDGVMTLSPRWSPDGERIAFITDRSGWANLWLVDAASGESRHLVDDNWEHAEPEWAPDGRSIVYTRNVDGNIHLMRVGAGGGTPKVLADGPGVHGSPSFSPDGKQILFAHQSPISPSNIYTIPAGGGERRAITRNTIAGLDNAGLRLPESITYPSIDGLAIHAMLHTPEQTIPGKHPLLVHIHGGPTAQTTWGWNPIVQYWVQRGWVVCSTNFRGSTGYGRAYTDAMHSRWGEIDMEDNVHAVYHLDQQGLIDRKRAVAWGGSGGGLATLSLLTQKPDVFKAGVDLYGVSNFVSFGEQTDRLARFLFPSEMGPMAENFDLYERNSPTSHADKVKAPLLIFQGLDDKRVPPRQSEEMVEAMQKAGKLVEYVTYAGEGHGWRKVETQRDYLAKMEAFLIKYVIER
ncbi:MAG: S9 family peptidase [Chloroflexia bacterium]